jgi:phosphoribosylformylglycinamidine synthase
MAAFGSSEYAKVILGELWGNPPALDLEAEADLQTFLQIMSKKKLVTSACDVSDGGIAVALAQSTFPHSIGVTVAQDPSLTAYPLFGLFAEPASTVLLTTDPSRITEIEKLATEYSLMVARIGTTGGPNLELSVYGNSFISAPVDDLRACWAPALEATLHEEVLA